MDPKYELRRFLRLCRWPDHQREMNGLAYRGPADFVLKEGRWWNVEPGLPAGVPHYGAPRACYGNSIYVATVYGLKYVQGYAFHDLVGPIAVPHAWVADASGRAWDVTWPEPGTAYLGVELSVERADDGTWNGDADPIDDFIRRWPLLRQPWKGETDPDPSWVPSPALRMARLARDGEREAALELLDELRSEGRGDDGSQGSRLRRMADDEIVTDEELRTLSDADLVRLIQERSNLDQGAAREALTVIRDEIPADTLL